VRPIYVLKHFPERLCPLFAALLRNATNVFSVDGTETRVGSARKILPCPQTRIPSNILDFLDFSRWPFFFITSPSIKRVLGYNRNNLAGQSAFSFIHQDDLSAVRDAFPRRACTHSNVTARLDFRFRSSATAPGVTSKRSDHKPARGSRYFGVVVMCVM
jgi:hypothetical protein